MKLENSTSSVDTAMAKEMAIKQVVTGGKDKLNQLGSWIKTNSAKLSLVGLLAFANPNDMVAQKSSDIAVNTNNTGVSYKPALDTAKNIVKIGEDPIKDSAEYKAETQKVSKERIELKKQIEHNNDILDQLEMIQGPINFLKKIEEKQGGVVTERDGKYARAGIAIIDKTNWFPDLKLMAEKARRILVYISSQAPQQVITKN